MAIELRAKALGPVWWTRRICWTIATNDNSSSYVALHSPYSLLFSFSGIFEITFNPSFYDNHRRFTLRIRNSSSSLNTSSELSVALQGSCRVEVLVLAGQTLIMETEEAIDQRWPFGPLELFIQPIQLEYLMT